MRHYHVRYPDLKLKLENVSQGNNFCINLIHYTDAIDFDFEFENTTSWIERGLLQFFDKKKLKLFYLKKSINIKKIFILRMKLKYHDHLIIIIKIFNLILYFNLYYLDSSLSFCSCFLI